MRSCLPVVGSHSLAEKGSWAVLGRVAGVEILRPEYRRDNSSRLGIFYSVNS